MTVPPGAPCGSDSDPELLDGEDAAERAKRLYAAARDGLEADVARLLEKRSTDPNKAEQSGNTPLFIAAEQGHLKVVEHLL